MSPGPWIAVTAFAFLGGFAPARADDFVPIVNGDDVLSFELVGIGPGTIKIEGGEVRVSGKPDGYFATKESYKNYTLKFDWMYERPSDLDSDARFRGNSGLLLHIQGPHKVWPKCIEVQLLNSSAGAIIPINGAKCQARGLASSKEAVKPVGQWNQEEVTCREGTITCTINGIEVSRGTGATVESGPIGWQSEGMPIRFRNVLIKALD
jgi:3-keto-disaccharide hydrolase